MEPGIRQLAIRARRISGTIPSGRYVFCVIGKLNNAQLISLKLRRKVPHSLKIDRMQVEPGLLSVSSAVTVRIQVWDNAKRRNFSVHLNQSMDPNYR